MFVVHKAKQQIDLTRFFSLLSKWTCSICSVGYYHAECMCMSPLVAHDVAGGKRTQGWSVIIMTVG
jgi:hypothetical protein